MVDNTKYQCHFKKTFPITIHRIIMIEKNWHSLEINETLEILDTDLEQGLNVAEVQHRMTVHGLNELPSPPRKSSARILANQFNDLLIYILIAAALITLVLAIVENPEKVSIRHFFDTLVIIIVLVINAAVGFYQEMKAEKAIESLQSMVSEHASVIRDGKMEVIDSTELVPGDVVHVNIGERVPADLRLTSSTNLRINESALTGESIAAAKYSGHVLAKEAVVGDRRNIAFMGTLVETGTGQGIVIATGSTTEVGQISSLVANIQDHNTPLQRKLEDLSSLLAKAILIISLFLVIFGAVVEFVHAESRANFLEAVLGLTIVGVSLAVAAIPEGLPIILTFTLAVSVQKMAKQNSIIRNLEAVETLGSTTVIATDKTGTLTQNELTMVRIDTVDDFLDIGQKDRNLQGPIEVTLGIMKSTTEHLSRYRETSENVLLMTDPLDRAIFKVVKSFPELEKRKVVEEIPFDSSRKLMSVIVGNQSSNELRLKGAPDVVLQRSDKYITSSGDVVVLTSEVRHHLENLLDKLAKDGYRVIGCGYRSLELKLPEDPTELEHDLVFSGFLSFIDPPRPEVYDALKVCYSAGIRVVMITGDHPQTALAIARQLGITEPGLEDVVTGQEIDTMDDQQLTSILLSAQVFARVTPAHKLRLVSLLKQHGEVVGMTGDGVNDSPALVKADIGVAMGITGTDAAKEAADMVLMDDNFATLVQAVEEGRGVNNNIRKFTNYLLASNTSEVLYLILGFFIIAIFQPRLLRELIPISETQILYLNLVTDSFLALALGMEKKEPGLMQDDPLPPSTPIVTKNSAIRIAVFGSLLAAISSIIFFLLLGSPSQWNELDHDAISYAQSFALTFLVLSEVFMAVSYRSSQPILTIGFWSNRFFVISIGVILVAQIAILYLPIMNTLFGTTPLGIVDWVLVILGSLLFFVLMELSKLSISTSTASESITL